MIFLTASGPNWCWHCGSKLAPVAGCPGAVYGETFKDPAGNEHRVHMGCYKRLMTPPITAQPRNMEVDRHEDDTDNWW